MTFSIVARDADSFGVAVASRFLAVGSLVPSARTGLGAVANQSLPRVANAAACLDALAAGQSAAESLRHVLAVDQLAGLRQLGLVGPDDAATFTGADCLPWAGGVAHSGEHTAYAIQGNLLTGPEVLAEMERAWLAGAGRPLVRRLLEALTAGDRAGGDRRGRQSAAVYAVRPGAGYDACGVLADFRVDDHADPVPELVRLVDLGELHFGHPEGVAPLTGPLAAEVSGLLGAVGVTGGEVAADLALWAGMANLETRLTPDGIDARVLEELRRAAGSR
ncbi:MAG TPA: DUF1028 domain-containing protein [Dermatophilaceae bacterium]|nr:DUF1028 domain-containing protein [Dermatophilaceae bacterium]